MDDLTPHLEPFGSEFRARVDAVSDIELLADEAADVTPPEAAAARSKPCDFSLTGNVTAFGKGVKQ
jgi:hypothetical protein